MNEWNEQGKFSFADLTIVYLKYKFHLNLKFKTLSTKYINIHQYFNWFIEQYEQNSNFFHLQLQCIAISENILLRLSKYFSRFKIQSTHYTVELLHTQRYIKSLKNINCTFHLFASSWNSSHRFKSLILLCQTNKWI